MKRAVLSLVLLTSVGCLHRSPEQQVLAAFRKSDYTNPVDFEPRENSLSKCSAPMEHVSTITGDTAVVVVFQDCIDRRIPPCPAEANCMGGNAVRLETDYLVVKHSGRWRVDRPISGGILRAG